MLVIFVNMDFLPQLKILLVILVDKIEVRGSVLS